MGRYEPYSPLGVIFDLGLGSKNQLVMQISGGRVLQAEGKASVPLHHGKELLELSGNVEHRMKCGWRSRRATPTCMHFFGKCYGKLLIGF